MVDLFSDARRLRLDGADVVYHPAPDLGVDPDELFERLRSGIEWQQHSVRIQDQVIPQPRLSSWHGDVVHTYSTLAHVLVPTPFDGLLGALRARLERLTGARYNSMLANLYRDGSDAIGWHSDGEPELGREPVIASISLGAERRFDLRRRDDHADVARIRLEHGSLLVMSGGTQRNWQHAIARTRAAIGERINLTFRLTAEASSRVRSKYEESGR
ncbi:alpha-ketoglutarate-dependent dioxygenase AlkB [Novosphingobium resinovorum]|uniref:Alpha-ketoglutarate-dependent dioxygenase AlkB n=1 Tax=Novosphingobium resinovorum TaxID=158500 RepID=A0A031JE94_9SPHN|nr:alpha-ketoglutarate-dependent dioxygenase AlkB [Novosphingobium resinovorum]EZP71506.1 alpha-ketoglutarate-dependent dioxygenase AlkB [Novosphingobium resinovorum]